MPLLCSDASCYNVIFVTTCDKNGVIMFPTNTYTLMAHYNQDMNSKMYRVCDTLSDQDRKQDRGAFFKSIHTTLNHILYGDRAWMKRFTGHDYVLKPMGEDIYDDYEALKAARVAMDQDILDFVNHIDEAWLKETMAYHSHAYSTTRHLPHWILLTHMFNHQTHHRGQISTLLTQLGLDIGVTDLPFTAILEQHQE